MSYNAETGLPFVLEQDAEGETAALYVEIKRVAQLTIVPIILTALGASTAALNMFWSTWRGMLEHTTLPQALVAMISYTIAEKSNCEYCSANHELNFRSLGVDEETLAKLVDDLQNVNPLRVQAIIEFALKAAKYPQEMHFADYEAVRQQGVSDEETLEIVMIASLAVASDHIADTLKVEVDDIVAQALDR